MATINRFEDIAAWQKARSLSGIVYDITKTGDFAKGFALKDQIRRASGSVMDNIAEGFDRGSKGEFMLFLGYAKGSNGEVQSQLYRAMDQQYISKSQFETSYGQTTEIAKMISGLISYLNKTNIKGKRFKKEEQLETSN